MAETLWKPEDGDPMNCGDGLCCIPHASVLFFCQVMGGIVASRSPWSKLSMGPSKRAFPPLGKR